MTPEKSHSLLAGLPAWVPVRISFHELPEVVGVARKLGVTENEAAGGILRVLFYFNEQSSDGLIRQLTAADVDGIATRNVCPRICNAQGAHRAHKSGVTCNGQCNAPRLAGWAEALAAVGWLIEENGGFRLRNFAKWNPQSMKRRAQTAVRVARFRKRRRNENVTPDVTLDQSQSQSHSRDSETDSEKSAPSDIQTPGPSNGSLTPKQQKEIAALTAALTADPSLKGKLIGLMNQVLDESFRVVLRKRHVPETTALLGLFKLRNRLDDPTQKPIASEKRGGYLRKIFQELGVEV
jgi:hypothetical protein